MEPINTRHTPPKQYPHGLVPATLNDRHLNVLVTGYAKRKAEGPPLNPKEQATYSGLVAEQDARREARKQGAA